MANSRFEVKTYSGTIFIVTYFINLYIISSSRSTRINTFMKMFRKVMNSLKVTLYSGNSNLISILIRTHYYEKRILLENCIYKFIMTSQNQITMPKETSCDIPIGLLL